MGGLSDASGVLCSPVTAKVTKPRFSGFPGEGYHVVECFKIRYLVHNVGWENGGKD